MNCRTRWCTRPGDDWRAARGPDGQGYCLSRMVQGRRGQSPLCEPRFHPLRRGHISSHCLSSAYRIWLGWSEVGESEISAMCQWTLLVADSKRDPRGSVGGQEVRVIAWTLCGSMAAESSDGRRHRNGGMARGAQFGAEAPLHSVLVRAER